MSRATVLVAIMAAPLMMVDVARGGNDNIIEGTYKSSSGAGFVLMVSLQRAQ